MLKKLLPTLLGIGSFAVTAFTPVMQNLISSHPTAAAAVSLAAYLIAHWAPSPAAAPAQ